MKLSRTSRLVRFAYWLPWPYPLEWLVDIPNETSLCAFFWRVTLRPLVLLLLVLSVVPLGILFAIITAGIGISWCVTAVVSKDARYVFSSWIAAKKDRFCPTIRFE